MEGLIIREAEGHDAQNILDYLRIVGEESENLTFSSEGLKLTVEEEKSIIEKVKSNPKSIFLCAYLGERLVGLGHISSYTRRMGHRATLAISVLKDFWAKGIGSMIMEELIAFSNKAGLEIVELEVRSDNTRAINLYEKFAFKKIATLPDFFKIGNNYYDFDLMYLDLRKQRG